MNILEIKNVLKHFNGVKALDSVSLEFERGKITSVIGPNGAGKTTLINVLTGMSSFDSGVIVIAGVHLKKIQPWDMPLYRTTRTFQTIRLFEQMTVLDNILVVLTERNVWSALFERHTKVHVKTAEDILHHVRLWEKRNALAEKLSYGQRKLLEIGRALAMNAEIYFFDEPFAGLFPEMVKHVIRILKDLRDQGKTVVLIEHAMDIIRELSDQVIVLDSGEFLAQGSPERVLARKDVLEAYLGE